VQSHKKRLVWAPFYSRWIEEMGVIDRTWEYRPDLGLWFEGEGFGWLGGWAYFDYWKCGRAKPE
jgi:hypothetical protein